MSHPGWTQAACRLCECNCGIEVQRGGADGRHIEHVRGDATHPALQGYACEKTHRIDFYQNGRHHLTAPQRRRPDGSFETIDWDTAIREVAGRLVARRDPHGGDRIFYYGGGQGNHRGGGYGAGALRMNTADAARLRLADGSGDRISAGAAPNELTASEDRDWIAGTP